MVFDAVTKTMKKVKGAYSVITMINQVGLFAFRDPNGIRPLVLGQRKALSDEDKDEWCIASEAGAIIHSSTFSTVYGMRANYPPPVSVSVSGFNLAQP